MDIVECEERTRHLVADLCPERSGDLLHLLDCPDCQELTLELLGEGDEPPFGGAPALVAPAAPGAGWPPGLVAAPAGAPEEEEVQRLYERLEATPPGERAALARRAELRSLPLVERLVAESRRAQPHDPRRSEELARLALLVAHRLEPRSEAGRVEDAKARATTLAANARRLLGDRAGAEELFRTAAFHLTGPPDSPARAFYCRTLALLRHGQGRLDEAAGLLWRAASIFTASGDRAAAAACLARLGLAFFENGEPERAIHPLTRATAALDPGRAPGLAVRSRLALALCHALAGKKEWALALVEAARPLFGEVTDPREVAASTWLLGRVTALAGRADLAADLLDAARGSFLVDRRLHEAALASIDLALLCAETGQADRLHLLIHELFERFPLSLEVAGVLRTVGWVVGFLERGQGDLRAAAAAGAARLRGHGALAFESAGEP